MKQFFRKLYDNSRPISQIIALCIIIYLPTYWDITGRIEKLPELEALGNFENYIFHFLWAKGNLFVGLFFSVTFLMIIRKWNKSCVFNKGSEYRNYPYYWYWIGSKLLGYTECSLVLVPIYLQFKLVLRDTFTNFHCDEIFNLDNDNITVEKYNFDKPSKEINLLISDTYPLVIEQIPSHKRDMSTIMISRDNNIDNNRYDNPQLVKIVVNEVRKLPRIVKHINIFATTNPKNSENIARNAFKLGERGNLELINVYQQERNGLRVFKEKGITVYKR